LTFLSLLVAAVVALMEVVVALVDIEHLLELLAAGHQLKAYCL
jgi:hypothetical protein